MSKKLTAADLMKWEPSQAQKDNGARCYAKRVMIEAARFEKAGDKLNADLRYEKMKQYCVLKGIEYPPGSTRETCLIPAKAWESEGAAAPENKLVGETGHGAQGEPATGFSSIVSPIETAAPQPSSVGYEMDENVTDPFAVPPQSPPVAEVKPAVLSKLTLHQQLMAQLAAMDEADKAQGKPAFSTPAIVANAEIPSIHPPVEPAQPIVIPKPVVSVEVKTNPNIRKAKVWNFCVNPKLANIKFLDGAEEVGSMWRQRVGLRFNEFVEVELERGEVGKNAIYQEVRKKV